MLINVTQAIGELAIVYPVSGGVSLLFLPSANIKSYSRSTAQHRFLHPRLPLLGPEFRHGCVVRGRYFSCAHRADAFFRSQPSDGMYASFGFPSFLRPIHD